MKQYRVRIAKKYVYDFVIKAESEQEAKKIARINIPNTIPTFTCYEVYESDLIESKNKNGREVK